MFDKNKIIKQEKKSLKSGFFGFWISNIRISILLIILLIVWGFFSVFFIKKEAFPKIDLWYINISTFYNWVNPQDIDSIITEKIEKNIKDISWIKKITSTSSVWVSSIMVEVESWLKVADIINEINSNIDKINFPESVEKPKVTELSISKENIFSVYLYWDEKKFSEFDLMQKANILKEKLENNSNISKIKIIPSEDYKIKVLLDKAKIEQIWLPISQISNLIKINNKNTPIWNYSVWDLNYDFRFDWELKNINELKNIIIKSSPGSFLRLWDISTIKLDYDSKNIRKIWFFEKNWFNYVQLDVEKSGFSSIFKASKETKKLLENIFENDTIFSNLNYQFWNDLSEKIKNDYWNLLSTARQTLILVFLTILFFVSFKESLIAVFILPLSFFATFIFLYFFWYTLNTLVNFSLILALTICIDTIIVIVESASEKQKIWYNKKYAILQTIKEYKSPLISWTLTTLAVFLPMVSLPWIIWKALSYIPITVFSTLLAWLVISLTISSAIFVFIASEKKYFYKDEEFEKTLNPSEKIFLESQREGKKELFSKELKWKQKLLNKLWEKYFSYLKNILKSKIKRGIIVFLPIILTFLSFIFISPKIWVSLFPENDSWILNLEITAQNWLNYEKLQKYLPKIENILSNEENIKNYTLSISKNIISWIIDFKDEKDRNKNLKDSENNFRKNLLFLEWNWLKFSISWLKQWGKSASDLWIKLIANDNSKLENLKKVSDDFEKFFKSLEWTKNVKTSSKNTPWQFVFKFDKNKLAEVWLTQNDILSELYLNINGTKAWTIKSHYEDNEIILKIEDFEKNFNPEDLLNFIVNTKVWKIRIWDFANYDFSKAVSSIERENWKISISVLADLEKWFFTNNLQPKINDFAQNYDYPNGINYEFWGENAENSELIVATFSSLFIAVFLMFFILVFQFKSFKQPLLILFSIILSLFWVNIGLFLTWNPYSISFMIWFISLAWIVINDAIILIDSMNKNLKKWLEPILAISSAWKSRLQPILVTTITTSLWVLPLALQWSWWSWLWYTIMFWIATWSFLTLFCIPTIFYNIYLKKVS